MVQLNMRKWTAGLGRVVVLGAAVALLAPAAGCLEEGGGGQRRPTKHVKKVDSGSVDDILNRNLEREAKEARYSYNSIGKRDPFRSFINTQLPRGGVMDLPQGPLQIHEIDQYRLRGIVWNVETPMAMVEDPEGVGYVVNMGTLIGKNWGKVTQIKPEEIVITEEFRDPIENELIINEITMRLPDAAEG